MKFETKIFEEPQLEFGDTLTEAFLITAHIPVNMIQDRCCSAHTKEATVRSRR